MEPEKKKLTIIRKKAEPVPEPPKPKPKLKLLPKKKVGEPTAPAPEPAVVEGDPEPPKSKPKLIIRKKAPETEVIPLTHPVGAKEPPVIVRHLIPPKPAFFTEAEWIKHLSKKAPAPTRTPEQEKAHEAALRYNYEKRLAAERKRKR